MDNSADPLARQLAVTALTTEHFNLQSARMGTITEANGRATLYLGTLSSAVIAIAFVGQANLDPAVAPYFPPTDPQGMTKLERIGVVASGPLQLLLTAASMVACINAIVGGVTMALAVRSLLDAPVPAAAVTGAVVALGLATVFVLYQVRRFRRAADVVPELYEGQSPTMPGWAGRVDS